MYHFKCLRDCVQGKAQCLCIDAKTLKSDENVLTYTLKAQHHKHRTCHTCHTPSHTKILAVPHKQCQIPLIWLSLHIMYSASELSSWIGKDVRGKEGGGICTATKKGWKTSRKKLHIPWKRRQEHRKEDKKQRSSRRPAGETAQEEKIN